MAPASAPPTYPATTIASDPYQKLPLAGTTGYTAEPQDMSSHISTTMPSMQLSMVSNDQQGQHATTGTSSQVPPIRTQYASYVQASAPPPALSAAATASNLSVPRYVDDSNPRPTKSPRHPSHPSIQSGTLAGGETSNEYRYGPSTYGSISSASTDISPGTAQHHSYSASAAGPDAAVSATASATVQPQRDYYPSPASWTTTAGESNPSTYSNGEHRGSYSYSAEPYKPSGTIKTEPHAASASVYPGQTMSHYSWNAS